MRKPWIIAHRGASGHAPENTLAAFERALQLGAPFIETDLHLTRDARFVAIHDGTLERTTNGRGRVQDFRLAELRELDAGQWFDRSFSGQRIPTIEEVLEFGEKHDVVFYLEIKYDVAWGMHHALIGALRSAQSTARTILLSFDPGTLSELRRLDSAVMTGLLAGDKSDSAAVQSALEAGARQLCPHAAAVSPELLTRAHAADLHIAPWTVNTRDQMRQLMSAGVDGIFTDFPDRLRAAIEDQAG